MGAGMEDQTKYSEIYELVAPVGRDKIQKKFWSEVLIRGN